MPSTQPSSTQPPTQPPIEAAPVGRSRRAIWIGLAAAPVLLIVASFLLVPPIARTQLIQILEARTGGKVDVGKIRFNPITLRAEVESFGLTEAGAVEPVISFESLVVDARWIGFLTSDAELDALVLTDPDIRVEIDEEGGLNLAQLFAAKAEDVEEVSAEAEEGAEAAPLILEIDTLQIQGGRVLLRDRQRSPVFELPIEPLHLMARNLSTSADREGTYDLRLSVGEHTELSWAGSIATQPLVSRGELDLKRFDLRWAATYLAEQLNFDLDSGELDLRAEYALEVEEGLTLSVEGADLALNAVSMLDPKQGEAFFGLERIEVGPIDARVNSLGLVSLLVEDVLGSGGRLTTVREKDASIRLVELFQPAKSEEQPTEAEAQETAADAPVPEIAVGTIRLKEFAVQFEDRVPRSPVTIALNAFSVDLKGFTSPATRPLDVRIEGRIGKQGQLEMTGPLELEPLSGTLEIKAEKIGLTDFAPYLEGIAQLEIPEGLLGASLDVLLEDRKGELSVSVKGRAQLDDLKTLDRGNSRKFVEWGSLRLEGLDYSPERLVLSEVVLSRAMARVVSDAKGRTNLDSIFASGADESGSGAAKGKTKPAADQGGAADSLKVQVDRITLDDVGFAFTDLAPDPHFTINLAALTGTVDGLSSEGGSRATVNLEGRIDDTAPIRVSGQINPLAGDVYTDVKIRVSGVSMPTFSPYSGRFAGYTIERGKLDLDLAYKLNAKKLRAENRIALHEFDFGQSVKSAEATNLPLPLVTEVLRKPNGDIELDIPLRGNLADPSFNIVDLAVKTFVNIITRIAASPFAIVGGLLPGQGEKISKVQFEAGSSTLSAAELDDLGVLAGVLVEKPTLQVEIRGRVDPAVDEPGVREALGSSDEIVEADWRALARARAKAAYDALVARPEIDPERLFMVEVQVGEFAGEDGQVATQIGLRVR